MAREAITCRNSLLARPLVPSPRGKHPEPSAPCWLAARPTADYLLPRQGVAIDTNFATILRDSLLPRVCGPGGGRWGTWRLWRRLLTQLVGSIHVGGQWA